MDIVQELIQDIPIPKMAKVKQLFDDEKIEDVDKALEEQLQKKSIQKMIKPGMEIAIAVGSRGVDKIVEVTAHTVKFLQDLGAKPFIVPSMRSEERRVGKECRTWESGSHLKMKNKEADNIAV